MIGMRAILLLTTTYTICNDCQHHSLMPMLIDSSSKQHISIIVFVSVVASAIVVFIVLVLAV